MPRDAATHGLHQPARNGRLPLSRLGCGGNNPTRTENAMRRRKKARQLYFTWLLPYGISTWLFVALWPSFVLLFASFVGNKITLHGSFHVFYSSIERKQKINGKNAASITSTRTNSAVIFYLYLEFFFTEQIHKKNNFILNKHQKS